jgi:hypothetical protein
LLHAAAQLPYSRAGFVRVNRSGAAGDVSGDYTGSLRGDDSGDSSGNVRGDVSGGSPLRPLLVQLRHEDDSGGAFAAVVLGGAEHPFSLAAWGRSELRAPSSELQHLEEGASTTRPKRAAHPSDFSLLVDLWLLDGSHRFGPHAPFTPNESRWHLALLEVDPRTSLTMRVCTRFRHRRGRAWFGGAGPRLLPPSALLRDYSHAQKCAWFLEG